MWAIQSVARFYFPMHKNIAIAAPQKNTLLIRQFALINDALKGHARCLISSLLLETSLEYVFEANVNLFHFSVVLEEASTLPAFNNL